jgi:hypothetical protein
MNIWTGLLFLDGSLSDVGLAAELAADEAPTAPSGPAAASPDREREGRAEEARAAQQAIPLWRKSPGIALR